jgi:hypothetical protein
MQLKLFHDISEFKFIFLIKFLRSFSIEISEIASRIEVIIIQVELVFASDESSELH